MIRDNYTNTIIEFEITLLNIPRQVMYTPSTGKNQSQLMKTEK